MLNAHCFHLGLCSADRGRVVIVYGRCSSVLLIDLNSELHLGGREERGEKRRRRKGGQREGRVEESISGFVLPIQDT